MYKESLCARGAHVCARDLGKNTVNSIRESKDEIFWLV